MKNKVNVDILESNCYENIDGIFDTITDEECYYVKDIAKYIFEKYHDFGRVGFDVVYRDLDTHPIFPSDGYKKEIISVLKDHYRATITRNEIIFSSPFSQALINGVGFCGIRFGMCKKCLRALIHAPFSTACFAPA